FVIFNPVDGHDQDRILGHSYDGIFGDAALVPMGGTSPADSHLPVDLGPLVEPLATVMYGWELLSLRGKPAELGIWGGGSAAVLAALLAELNGARAHIFHRRPERLEWLAHRQALAAVSLHCLRDAPSVGSCPQLDAGIICVPRKYGVVALEH